MTHPLSSVILPSETQSREFDGKLLLACALAEAGLPTFVGSRIAIHARIADFPRSVYLAKDFRKPSAKIFGVMKNLGHRIMAWDEEAVLFFSAKEFHERRVHPPTFAQVAEFFAWGEENADYLRSAPGYAGAPIHVTGNPRFDLLRSELRGFFDAEAQRYRAQFGDYLLINTNFGKLNHFVPKYTVRPGGQDASVGGQITPFMAEAWTHRLAIFEAFQQLLPRLAAAYPDRQIVLRPHPAENHDTWRQAAESAGNVHVIHQGNVYGWLRGCAAMIHNGCTTGLEAFLIGAPVISYRPSRSDRFDLQLANSLSLEVDSFEALTEAIDSGADEILARAFKTGAGRAAGRYIAALDGPLAFDRMTPLIAAFAGREYATPPIARQWLGRAQAWRRALGKSINAWRPQHKNSHAYNRQRFPGIAQDEVQAKIDRFAALLARFDGVRATPVARHIYRIERLRRDKR